MVANCKGRCTLAYTQRDKKASHNFVMCTQKVRSRKISAIYRSTTVQPDATTNCFAVRFSAATNPGWLLFEGGVYCIGKLADSNDG